MTTIVYRDGIIAGDRRFTDGEMIMPYGKCSKVGKNAKGWIYGCAGNSGPMLEFMQWMNEFQPVTLPNKRMPRGEYYAIVVDPEGKIYNIEKGVVDFTALEAPFYATGSGQGAALGALYHGATAIEAVEIAMQIDKNSGGGVDAIKLKEDNE